MHIKKNNNFLYTMILLIVFILAINVIIYFVKQNVRNEDGLVIKNAMDEVSKMKAVVVAVNDNYMTVMKKKESTTMKVYYAEEGNIGFKQGQEVEIKYRGITPESNSIIKEKSNIEIPDRILRNIDYSKDKVSVTVKNMTNMGITYQIIDNNTIPYKYGNGLGYKILKKVRNNEKEECYMEVEKEDVSSKDTIMISKDENNIFEREYNWEKLYGKLDVRRI